MTFKIVKFHPNLCYNKLHKTGKQRPEKDTLDVTIRGLIHCSRNLWNPYCIREKWNSL